jgi:hypothetical protein
MCSKRKIFVFKRVTHSSFTSEIFISEVNFVAINNLFWTGLYRPCLTLLRSKILPLSSVLKLKMETVYFFDVQLFTYQTIRCHSVNLHSCKEVTTYHPSVVVLTFYWFACFDLADRGRSFLHVFHLRTPWTRSVDAVFWHFWNCCQYTGLKITQYEWKS